MIVDALVDNPVLLVLILVIVWFAIAYIVWSEPKGGGGPRDD